jgi:hypothetical protein
MKQKYIPIETTVWIYVKPDLRFHLFNTTVDYSIEIEP